MTETLKRGDDRNALCHPASTNESNSLTASQAVINHSQTVSFEVMRPGHFGLLCEVIRHVLSGLRIANPTPDCSTDYTYLTHSHLLLATSFTMSPRIAIIIYTMYGHIGKREFESRCRIACVDILLPVAESAREGVIAAGGQAKIYQ